MTSWITRSFLLSRDTVSYAASTFVSVKPLDNFNETSGHFPAVFLETEPGILSQNMFS